MNQAAFIKAVQDPNLSWNATGVLCYMLTHHRQIAMACDKADTDENFCLGLQELIEQGWIQAKDGGCVVSPDNLSD